MPDTKTPTPPTPTPVVPPKPFTPPAKPGVPGFGQFKKPNFNTNPRFGNTAFRNQNRGSGGK